MRWQALTAWTLAVAAGCASPRPEAVARLAAPATRPAPPALAPSPAGAGAGGSLARVEGPSAGELPDAGAGAASLAVEGSTPQRPPAPEPPAPRLTSQGYFTWIWPSPKAEGRYLGYVRFGSSVALAGVELVRGAGCHGGFHRVVPRGFVCHDHTVTLEPSPRLLALGEALAPAKGAFPYRYALSDGAPRYNRVATAKEQASHERSYGPAGTWHPLHRALAAHADLASPAPAPPDDPEPPFLARGEPVWEERRGLLKGTIPLGSMLSFTRAFAAEGRTWLLSSDLTLVPADRARVFRPSAFHGTRLGGDARLPLAWMRRTARPKARRSTTGAFEKTGEAWPLRSFVGLTGTSEERDGARWLETAERGADGARLYLAEADATVVAPRERRPTGVTPGQKWMLVRITDGTLVAYEDLTPVYATLISPGAGGVPVKGRDPVQDGATPLGAYSITFKDRAATMSPEKGEDRSFWIADVPHTQYFDPPFALHAAYWHERFGEPTSAGCVNLSPLDAEALFDWSDPQVPEGWAGATGASAPENGPSTVVVIAR